MILLFASVTASAQTYQEVVYLKNGSVIRGVVIEQVPNESLKIQTADGSIYVYQMDEVEKITKEATGKTGRTKSKYFTEYEGLQRGLRFFFDFGMGYGQGDNGGDVTGGDVSVGYQIFPQLFAGAGYGINRICGPGWKVKNGMPLFIQIRSDFSKNKPISPFLDLRCGYSLHDAPGLYVEPSIGVRFSIVQGLGFNLIAGAIGQRMKDSDLFSENDFNVGIKRWTGSVFWKIGLDYNLPMRRK